MRALLGGLVGGLLLTNSAYAQGNPGDFARPGPAAERMAYYAHVRTELNDLLIGWQRAFQSDEATGLAAFYAEAASYYPTNAGPLHTRGSIQYFFVSHLRTVADVQVQMVGFGTSGDLAYVTARVTQYVQGNAGGIKPVVSTDLFVFRRQNSRAWHIQAQLAQPDRAEKLP